MLNRVSLAFVTVVLLAAFPAPAFAGRGHAHHAAVTHHRRHAHAHRRAHTADATEGSFDLTGPTEPLTAAVLAEMEAEAAEEAPELEAEQVDEPAEPAEPDELS